MEIKKTVNGKSLDIALAGRLDANSAPDLEKVIQKDLAGIEDLTIDMSDISYIASAGLRVLLVAQKRMNRQGSMKIIHVNDEVMEVFEITGFSDFLKIEN